MDLVASLQADGQLSVHRYDIVAQYAVQPAPVETYSNAPPSLPSILHLACSLCELTVVAEDQKDSHRSRVFPASGSERFPRREQEE